MDLERTIISALDAIDERITVIDEEGRIVFCNRAYRELLKRELGEKALPVEGKLLRELRPGARLPDVLRDGKPAVRILRKESASSYFANTYPIREEGKVRGGISVGLNIQDAYLLTEEYKKYEQKRQQAIKTVNQRSAARYTFDDIVAVDPRSKAIKAFAYRIAQSDVTVLLQSETGTGKELYAQAIHNASGRHREMFVPVNCANFTSSMLESELFGYVDGAFTGAKKGGKIGLFEAANGGTLFLDEISEMDLPLQSKLLRALQERRIRPVGGVREVDVDVRIIAACNADLAQYVENGKFRKDLYFRLDIASVKVPPLRDRPEDIPELSKVIIQEMAAKMKRPLSITSEAVMSLQRYHWPGNVRELRNVLELSAFMTSGETIEESDLPPLAQDLEEPDPVPLKERIRAYELQEIRRTVQRYGDTTEGKCLAAKALGISLSTLYRKLDASLP